MNLEDLEAKAKTAEATTESELRLVETAVETRTEAQKDTFVNFIKAHVWQACILVVTFAILMVGGFLTHS